VNTTMAEAITALIAEKRATGYKYDAEERVLTRFTTFCADRFPDQQAPTRAAVEAWLEAARGRGVTPATLQSLAAPVRELARWFGRRRVSAYVLPAGTLPRPARYVPHIYTDSELAALFARSDCCHYDSQVPFGTWSCRCCSARSTPADCVLPRPGCCVSAMSTPGS
jgi:integrase/recombinase XerD